MKRSILQSLLDRFSPACETVMPSSPDRLRLSGKAIRIPVAGQPAFRIELGKQTLHLAPDTGIADRAADTPCDFILFDPERFLSRITHFLRVSPGQTLVIDSKTDFQKFVFSHPREAFRRHLTITHTGDALIVKDTISELGTYISLLDDDPAGTAITARRRASLMRIPEIFGGPLAPLTPEQATAQLVRVNRLLKNEPCQLTDSMGNPGGIIELPDLITPVIVGDLHARIDNLIKILCENTILDSLEKGSAALIILGDAVHQDAPGQLEEMDSSLLMMDLVLSLKLRFPGQVFYLTGNHDSFLHELMKKGIPQGLLWDKHVVAARGEKYREQLELFYRQSPLLAVSRDFIACHAGPARRSVSRQILVDARQFPDIVHDLTWGRVKSPAFPAGYTRGNVKQFRKGLQASPETPFIVGHHPVSENDTLWLDVGQIRQHHVVISSRPDRIGLFTRIDGEMVPQLYPAEPLLDWLNRQVSRSQH